LQTNVDNEGARVTGAFSENSLEKTVMALFGFQGWISGEIDIATLNIPLTETTP